MTRIITFGTYDIFHVGHLRLLDRARAMGDHLTVGVSTDELNESKKGRRPIYSFAERCEILRGLRIVDEIFPEESLEKKRDYLVEHRADILVMGDDWEGRFDDLADTCEVRYLPRTPAVSTTAVIEKIRA
ncbi:adenylyltransferase/cytidyltransferase family protein [Actinospongicola halichondriae]|uniref:adenylyltransferase/cytidyltransferase family protein n=1 Tax=Actinospongicola halichondriae TaxID=3236844 RepID=UPI003D54A02B